MAHYSPDLTASSLPMSPIYGIWEQHHWLHTFSYETRLESWNNGWKWWDPLKKCKPFDVKMAWYFCNTIDVTPIKQIPVCLLNFETKIRLRYYELNWIEKEKHSKTNANYLILKPPCLIMLFVMFTTNFFITSPLQKWLIRWTIYQLIATNCTWRRTKML